MKTKLCLCACCRKTVTTACQTVSKTKLANMCAKEKEKENKLKIMIMPLNNQNSQAKSVNYKFVNKIIIAN